MKLVKLVAMALVAAGPALADGGTAAKTPSDAVKVKIAALDHDGAKAALKELEAQAKSKEAKAEAKALEKEVGFISRIEPLVKKVQKLLDDGKARAAYESGMAGVDQFPGAIALAALMVPTRKAREQCCLVIDDFDATKVPDKLEEGAKGKSNTKYIGEVAVGNSKVQAVPDPMGGRALRWTWDSIVGDASAIASWTLSAGTDLTTFEAVSIRMRSSQPLSKPLEVLFINGDKREERARSKATLLVGPAWRELRIPLDKLENQGKFDPRAVKYFYMSCAAKGPVDLYLDEIVFLKRGK